MSTDARPGADEHPTDLGEQPDHEDRDETPSERLDRKFEDLLQELRVAQTGAQLVAGILVTLPFQPTFADLDSFQRGVYLVLLAAALLTTAAVLTPIAVHRRLSGRRHKDSVVRTAHWALGCVLASLSVLVTGIAVLVVDVVVDRTAALAAGGALAVLLGALLVALPHRLVTGHR